MTNDYFLEKFNFNDAVQIVIYLNDAHGLYVIGWKFLKKEVFEQLPPLTKKLIPFNIEAPILEYKPLPKDLKMCFKDLRKNFR